MSEPIELRYGCGHTLRAPLGSGWHTLEDHMCPPCRWAWRRPVPMSVEHRRAYTAAMDQSQRWPGLSAHGIGSYLLSIGTLCALEGTNPQAQCWWDGGWMLRVNVPVEDLCAALDAVATGRMWRGETGPTKHLAFIRRP